MFTVRTTTLSSIDRVGFCPETNGWLWWRCSVCFVLFEPTLSTIRTDMMPLGLCHDLLLVCCCTTRLRQELSCTGSLSFTSNVSHRPGAAHSVCISAVLFQAPSAEPVIGVQPSVPPGKQEKEGCHRFFIARLFFSGLAAFSLTLGMCRVFIGRCLRKGRFEHTHGPWRVLFNFCLGRPPHPSHRYLSGRPLRPSLPLLC